jgi:uncharacterized coiled-coil protein SlyX
MSTIREGHFLFHASPQDNYYPHPQQHFQQPHELGAHDFGHRITNLERGQDEMMNTLHHMDQCLNNIQQGQQQQHDDLQYLIRKMGFDYPPPPPDY